MIALGLALTLNHLTKLLALVGGVLVVTYPFFKRFFPLPQFYLGAAFTWSVPMAFAAQTGAVPRLAWLLFIAGVLWTMAYDTMYAMVDREDDRKLGIRSSAILFGDADRFIVGVMQLMTLLRALARRPRVEAGRVVRRRPRGRSDLRALRAVPDPRAQAGRLFQSISQQQLLRHVGVYRHRARVFVSHVSSEAASG